MPPPPTFFGRRQTIGFLMISGEWKSINSLNPLSASVTSFYMRATLGLNGLKREKRNLETISCLGHMQKFADQKMLRFLKLVSAIFLKYLFFHQMIALQKL